MPLTKDQAAANVAAAQKNLADAQAAEAALAPAAAGPRPPEVVMADLFDQIVMALHNRPQLRALVTEFREAAHIEPPAPAPTE
jgi:hypothetical protein